MIVGGNRRGGSTIILPPTYLRAAVAQSLAATDPEDLQRLKTVLEEAQGTDASADDVAKRLEEEVPTASPLAQLLQDGAMPLAAWLTFIVAVLTLLLMLHQEQTPPRTITPQQVEEIITGVVDKLDVEPAAEQPAIERPNKKRERRSGR